MANVKILHAGGVGEHKQDDIVYDAHAGLVHIAKHAVRNAADGELLAVFCDDEGNQIDYSVEAELDDLRAQAKDLGVKGNLGAMKSETLRTKIEEAKAAKAAEEEATKQLEALKEQAKELNVEGFEEMEADQLKEAIEKAKQANNQ